MTRDSVKSKDRPNLLSVAGLLAARAWFGFVGVQARSRAAHGEARGGPGGDRDGGAGGSAPAGRSPGQGGEAPKAQTSEQRLEEAVRETFPASGPVSIHIE